MQRAQKAPLPLETERTRVGRTAWMVLLTAFAVFCLIGGSAAYGGWRYRSEATQAPLPGGHLIIRSPAFTESVTWTERGAAKPRIASDGQELNEGDSIGVFRTDGSPYGQMASVRLFDQTQVDLWAGADLLLRKLQVSRWSGRVEQVTITQRNGYVRYDVSDTQLFEQVVYRVLVGEAEVLLEPGGSYSVDIASPERRVVRLGQFRTAPMLGDVAVRRGRATVIGRGTTLTITAGEKVSLDPTGTPARPVPARWDLIADSRFGDYSEEQYNNTTLPSQDLVRSGTWQVTSKAAVEGGTPNGFFRIYDKCLPLGAPSGCPKEQRINVANFYRDGGQTTGFLTGIRQPLRRDVSEYRTLQFSMWLRVLNQSLSVGGIAGAECPVMVKFIYKNSSPADPENQIVHCFFARDDTGDELRAGEIEYHQVKPYEWFHFRTELRTQDLPDARYIQEVQIYADGHDYNAEVTDISLIGSQ